ncbi:HK97 gp10 family phage protein, partial [Roseateles sp.]|uniref:HK97 gp10 family phage protein n=1 Tax=Roseateles sp. TaxID=1971397 RepID=UPI002F413C24
MSGELDAVWRGIDECKARLVALPDKLRRRVLRNALAAGARIVRDEARRATPLLREPHPYRKRGTVRD